MIRYLCLGILLAGCTTLSKPPEIVKVPVAVRCVKLPLPVRPVSGFGASTGTPFPCENMISAEDKARCSQEIVSAAEREMSRWEQYANELESAISGCVSTGR